jgi:hypothetical protein
MKFFFKKNNKINNMVKIAFGYKRGVGKDTSCDYLIKKYGGEKLSFAQPLYKILHFAQTVCSFEQTKDRKFLQFIGTEWARSINNDVWVNLLVEQTKKYKDNRNIFVSDLRFQNEFKALKDHGFICVHLKSLKDSPTEGYNNHSSDMDLDNFDGWDYTIENYSSLEYLYHQLSLLFHHCYHK